MFFTYCFLRDVHEGYLSLEEADDEQSNFAAKLKNLDKGKKYIEKEFFLNNLGLLFSAREKVFINIQSGLVPIKNLDKSPTRESAPELAKNQLNRGNLN